MNPLKEKPGPRGSGFLFADAEVGEDVSQDVVGVDSTCDFAEVMQGLAGVDRHEVARHLACQSLSHGLKRLMGCCQRFKVTEVGDDQSVSVVVGLVRCSEQVLELVNALTFGSAQVNHGMVPSGFRGRGEVAFVPNHHHMGVSRQLQVAQLSNSILVSVGGCVEQHQDGGGGGGFLQRPTDALGFHHVLRDPESGGVDEPEAQTLDGARVFYRVARRSRDVRYNGPVVAQQGVEQGGFSAVGRADDGHRNALFQRVSGGEAVGQTTDPSQEVDKQCVEPIAVSELDILLGKIELQFQEAGESDERFSKGVDFLGEAAAELVQGEAMGACVLRGNQVRHGFRLGEVETAVQEGALGEFTGTRLPTAGLNEGAHDFLLNERGTVDVELNGVFSGVGLGAAHHQSESFIQGVAGCIFEFTERDGAVGDRGQGLGEHLGSERESLVARHPDDRDPTCPWGGGNGTNGGAVHGVAKGGVHGANLA